MKVLLTTLNARFSHCSLALRYLRGVLRTIPGIQTTLREYTINQPLDEILSEIALGGYDAVCFSTYIWNVEPTLRLAANLKKIDPCLSVLLGGPEVSYEMETFLRTAPAVDGIFHGEGEETLREVFAAGLGSEGALRAEGTAWRVGDTVVVNPGRALIRNLDTLPFPYEDSDALEHRLVYFETARGCPYNCRYCLSSASEGLRRFSLPRVFADLQWLSDRRVGTVKLVDRTFNADPEHFMPILEHLRRIDNGITCYHLEISAGILTEPALQLLEGLRPGLVQLEIGVQSTCPEALKAVGRPDWTERIAANVRRLKAVGNMHLHLDLIAGLPFEGYDRFLVSFDAVHAMGPDMLQLGFLKLIRGTELRQRAAEYGYQWREEAPYEVLASRWISFEELDRLKKIEALLDRYYHGQRFQATLGWLIGHHGRPSAFYEALRQWWGDQGLFSRAVSAEEGWLLLYRFGIASGVSAETLRNRLRWDCVRSLRPRAFQGTPLEGQEPEKGALHRLLHQAGFFSGPLEVYRGRPAKQLLKELHFEWLEPLEPLEAQTGAPVLQVFDLTGASARWVGWISHEEFVGFTQED